MKEAPTLHAVRVTEYLRTLVTAALLVVGAGCTKRPTDVVLITVDTLRADHLSTYGYAKPTSPRIDEFARGATVFEQAISQAPLTIPSILQIMTSRYMPGGAIRAEDVTLAEVLRRAAYQTAAVVENSNFEIDRAAHGLPRGFDRFYRNGVLNRTDLEQQHYKTGTPGDAITAQAVRWVRARERDRPAFLWLHYFDPHDPYMPPFSDDMEELSWGPHSRFTGDIRRTFLYREDGEAFPDFNEDDRQHLVDLYDAEIRYADQAIGDLFEALKSEDMFESALVILTADHGESFGDHGYWTHGHSLYDSEIHIPMIVKFPYQRHGERVALPVQAIDVYPTVLDVLHISSDGLKLHGTSLQRRMPRLAFAFFGKQQVVRSAAHNLVLDAGRPELFRLSDDPRQLHDIAGTNAHVVEDLTAAQYTALAALRLNAEQMRGISDQTVERLHALGYLQ